jgi:hypothetical protein
MTSGSSRENDIHGVRRRTWICFVGISSEAASASCSPTPSSAWYAVPIGVSHAPATRSPASGIGLVRWPVSCELTVWR